MNGPASERRSDGVAAGEVLVCLAGATLRYRGDLVVRGVDWTIRSGERWFLIGPNGSGKTTLLRGILGLLEPRSGTIERDPHSASLARVGFVAQRWQPSRALPTTVRELVELGLVGLEVPRAERAGRVREALAAVRLEGRATADYWALSGGQRQRVGVARALVRRPSLLLLDEPTDSLDFSTEAAFLEILESLHRTRGVTWVFVTHRMDLALGHATHLALAWQGQLVAGPLREVLRNAAVEAAFGPHIRHLAEHTAGLA